MVAVHSVTHLSGLTIGSANTLTSSIVSGVPNGARVVIVFGIRGGTSTLGQGTPDVVMDAPWERLASSRSVTSSVDIYWNGVVAYTARKVAGTFPTTATLWSNTLSAPFVLGDATQNAELRATPIFDAMVVAFTPSYGYSARRHLARASTAPTSDLTAPNKWTIAEGTGGTNSVVPGTDAGLYLHVDLIEPRTISGAPNFGQDVRTGVSAANGFTKDYEDATWCVASQEFTSTGTTPPLIHTVNRNANALPAFAGRLWGVLLAFDVVDPAGVTLSRRGLGLIRG